MNVVVFSSLILNAILIWNMTNCCYYAAFFFVTRGGDFPYVPYDSDSCFCSAMIDCDYGFDRLCRALCFVRFVCASSDLRTNLYLRLYLRPVAETRVLREICRAAIDRGFAASPAVWREGDFWTGFWKGERGLAFRPFPSPCR